MANASRRSSSVQVRKAMPSTWVGAARTPSQALCQLSYRTWCGAHGRDRNGDLPLRRRTLCPTELRGRVERTDGLEPTTSTLEGWRSTN